MDSMYIREFLNLSETCSYQETAENMNVSISSLSKHIHKLEEELEVFLFDRTTRNVQLNEYGLLFREYAQRLTALDEECRQALHHLRSRASARLTIGFLPIMFQYGLMEMVSDFTVLHPDVNIQTIEGNHIMTMFSTERCDMVFSDDNSTGNAALSRTLFCRDNLVVLLPHGHPLAGERKLSVEKLRGERFLLHGRSPALLYRDSQVLIKLCQKAGFEPDAALVSSRCSAIVKLVCRGTGVAVMNYHQIPTAMLDQISVVDLDPFSPINIYILTQKDQEISPACKMFLHFVKKQKPDFRRPLPSGNEDSSS